MLFKKVRSFSIILALFVMNVSISFAAPGNVANNLQLWLRADDNGGVTTDGSSVSTWSDMSGNNNNGTSIGSPTYHENFINFNPVLTFNGSSDGFNLPNGTLSINDDNYDYYAIFTSPLNQNLNTLFFSGVNTQNGWVRVHVDSDGSVDDRFNSAGVLNGNPGKISANVPAVANTWYDTDSNKKSIYINGIADRELNNVANKSTTNNNHSVGYNAASNTHYFEGAIAELIAYNASNNDTDRRKITSYLALKYGITLGHNGTNDNNPRNFYLDGNGNQIYSIQAYQFRSNIIGIGKDSSTGLDQRISRSQSAELTPVLTISTDNNFTAANNTHADTLTDGQYLIVGAKGTTADPNDTQAISHATFKYRIKRDWRAENTGSVGAVHLKFDGFDSTWHVLKTKAGTVNNYNDGVDLGRLNANGEITLTLDDGAVFTLAKPAAPGGVDSNLSLWLKANDNGSADTDGSTVSTWYDRSSNTYTLTANDTPELKINTLNFNPTVLYQNHDRHMLSNQDDINIQNSTVFAVGMPRVTSGGYGAEFWASDGGGANEDGQDADVVLYRSAFNSPGNIVYYDNKPGYGGEQYRQSGQTWSSDSPNIIRASFENAMPYDITYAKNGGSTSTLTDANQLSYNNGSPNIDYTYKSLGNWLNNNYAEPFGNIAETIIYQNGAMSAADVNKVESYLALKYGITLDQTTPTDYTSSDGTKFWDSNVMSQYKHNIFGIGRDDSQALDQRVSKSVNPEAIITVATTNDFTAANQDASRTSLDDKHFVTVATNNYSNTWNGVAPAGYKTLERSWKYQITGGAVTKMNMHFDVDDPDLDIPPAANGQYYIVVDRNGSNLFSDETPEALDANNSIDLNLFPAISQSGVYTGVFTLATQEINITIDDVSVDENAGTMTFTLTADKSLQGGFSVDVSTTDGTATAGTDYTAITNQTVTFTGNAGEQQTVTVTINDDNTQEADETFTISMSNPSSAILNITDTATGTILNDDSNNNSGGGGGGSWRNKDYDKDGCTNYEEMQAGTDMYDENDYPESCGNGKDEKKDENKKKPENIKYGCKDSKAENYNSAENVVHKASLCEYKEQEENKDERDNEDNKTDEILNKSSCPHFTSYQKIGSRGYEVEKIQAFLKKFGFFNHEITGYYGAITDKAVKAFQARYANEILAPWGISSPTGWWYKTTRAKANELMGCSEGKTAEELVKDEKQDKKQNEEQKTEEQTGVQNESIDRQTLDTKQCPFFTRYFKLGDRDEEIKKIQIFLRKEGVFDYGEATGYYGPVTDRAIRAFQAKYANEILKPWGLSSPTGWWYKSTRAKANELAGCKENNVRLDNGIVLP